MSYSEFREQRANSVDPDEVAHNEPPHLDLHSFANSTVLTLDAFNV